MNFINTNQSSAKILLLICIFQRKETIRISTLSITYICIVMSSKIKAEKTNFIRFFYLIAKNNIFIYLCEKSLIIFIVYYYQRFKPLQRLKRCH